MKKTAVQAYLEEQITVGGEVMARGTLINRLREAKVPEYCINAYLAGLETGRKARGEAA
jgi:hypothetical protein